MEWVIDSSIALAWALPDETSKEAERFLSRVSIRSILWVPALWWYEMANALLMARRRKRLIEADRIRLMELYRELPIRTDMMLDSDIMWRFYTQAVEYNLSAYDAAYLELAQRRGLGLATADRPLRLAAERAGIKTTS
ncbi:MAG: type II toxin-antitoxin system VapC family toxin [Deltaproteobacteria bacterium]|nr:type II toxin-antitoxin system VapC family toxin [Deltaproteobacteria bacterium]MBM4339134.1 type II toxin-antitoxin system VapC family toxin [Deltaproteobacteria bacterium]